MSATNSTKEEWRRVAISPYGDNYKVSTHGRVKRYTATTRATAGKILKPIINRSGYAKVRLYKDGKSKFFTVQKIVMTAFVGPPPTGKQINHINGDKADNKLANLEYITAAENVQHSWRTGLCKPVRGEKSGASKLTERQVLKIRRLRQRKVRIKTLAKRFKVAEPTIKAIIYRKHWRHI